MEYFVLVFPVFYKFVEVVFAIPNFKFSSIFSILTIREDLVLVFSSSFFSKKQIC